MLTTGGISMGSPLETCFSNYYMAHLENKIFNTWARSMIYAWYIDDVIILAKNLDEIKKPKRELSSITPFFNSCMNSTSTTKSLSLML